MFENVILLIVGVLVGLGSGIYFLRNKYKDIYSLEVTNLNYELKKIITIMNKKLITI